MGVALTENIPTVASNILATNQNRENLRRSAESTAPHEGVVNSEVRELGADKKENALEGEGPEKNFQDIIIAQQQALEQAAMTGLSESLFFSSKKTPNIT